MRRFCTALFILLGVVIASIWFQWQVGVSADKVLSSVPPLKEALLAEDAQKSEKQAEAFLALWKEENGWMYFLLQHNHIDEAEESGENLLLTIRSGDFSAALRELTNIEHTLLYLSQKDHLTLKNLF